jgi:RNA polymerase sigma-70 factor (ECF subfamily)
MAIYIDDRELIAAHRAGDGEAFDELVREHRQSLLAHAKRKLHCDATSEDALQETLVRAYRALPKFDGEYRLGPWLHRIMHNVCIDEAVRRRRDGEKTDKFAAQVTPRSDAPSIEDELGLHFDDSALQEALEELSEPYREALELKFVKEYDYSELAAHSGVSEENARARVSRARLAMRSALKGVASLPILLVGLLKRGEKAAAAATSTSGAVAVSTSSSAATATLPTLAEAGTVVAQVAPNVMPVVAKAAVGIGLAAAVLTPTADSAVHQAVEQLTNSSAGVVIEQDVDQSSSLGDAIVISTGTASDASTFATGAESVSLSGDELAVSELGAGRYAITGALSLSVGEIELEGQLNDISWIRVDPELSPDNRHRVDGLLEVLLPDVGYGTIRLAGFATDTPDGLEFSGVYRYVGDLDGIASEGSFEGLTMLSSQPASVALQLAS